MRLKTLEQLEKEYGFIEGLDSSCISVKGCHGYYIVHPMFELFNGKVLETKVIKTINDFYFIQFMGKYTECYYIHKNWINHKSIYDDEVDNMIENMIKELAFGEQNDI